MTAARVTGLLSAADLVFEPEDGLRRELHDGVLHVVPPPGDRHSWEINVGYHALLTSAPDDVYILQNVGVHVGLRRLYVPDLTVVHRTRRSTTTPTTRAACCWSSKPSRRRPSRSTG